MRLVTLKKGVHVKFIVNYGVDQSTCLITQHSWSTTLQQSGQLGSHTDIAHKHNLSMLLTQVPCSFTSALYPGTNVPALADHIFSGYLFLCLIDAHGKTSLCGFHQEPLDSGQIELLQIFCEDDSYDYTLFPDPPK